MTEKQLQFFRALQAPFTTQVRTRTQAGRTLSYITSRDVMNRLDEVCGPYGWFPEYKPSPFGENGAICKLNLLVPIDDEEWRWVAKEDGGASAGMPESDNDDKSGFSDSLKRAAVAWGISRELYQAGMPNYIQGAPPANSRQPEQAHNPVQNRAPAQGPAKRFDRLPKAGTNQVWAWVKSMESHFGYTILDGLIEEAEALGVSTRTNEWDEDTFKTIIAKFIEFAKHQNGYNGEFSGITEEMLRPTSDIDWSKN